MFALSGALSCASQQKGIANVRDGRPENPLPIVFVQVTDPIGSGFVPNLARPGGAEHFIQ